MSTQKTVLITGASSGFGLATAKLLAERGFRLVLIARSKERLVELQKSVQVPVYVEAVDVRDKEGVAEFVKNLPKEFGEIDVLVNNAGLALENAPAYEANIDDWEVVVDTNIKGVLHFTHAVLPSMKQRNCGTIINIGSSSAHIPYKGGNVYGATKAFVRQFSRNLRTDLLGTNIHVTNIEPGGAETGFSITRFRGDVERAKKVYANARFLTAEDIAETILWVLERPERVNIDNIEIMPIDQTYGGLTTHRG